MRTRTICWAMLLALMIALSGASLAAAATARSVPAKKPAAQAGQQLLVNGKPAPGRWILRHGVPLVAAASLARAKEWGASVATSGGELALGRPQATVRVKPGVKEMRVDGQRVPLKTAAVREQGNIYVPVEVLQALCPDYRVALAYQPKTKAVALTYRPKQKLASAPVRRATPPAPAAADATSAGCGPANPNAEGVPTQEFGKKGAKLEIIALLPITHGCHVNTEAELKAAYEKHPKDIHLTIVDLFGADAPTYLKKVGGGQRAVVSINGKTSFTLDGRPVRLEMMEGRFYQPFQIGPIIEHELKAS